MRSYRVVFERDGRGVWLVTVPAVEGCHSYGRSLEEARRNLREALGLFVDDASRARLVEEVRVPARLRRAVARVQRARRHAELVQTAARSELAKTARSLTTEGGLSLRDAGDLLGISRQRVQQLVAGGRSSG